MCRYYVAKEISQHPSLHRYYLTFNLIPRLLVLLCGLSNYIGGLLATTPSNDLFLFIIFIKL